MNKLIKKIYDEYIDKKDMMNKLIKTDTKTDL